MLTNLLTMAQKNKAHVKRKPLTGATLAVAERTRAVTLGVADKNTVVDAGGHPLNPAAIVVHLGGLR